MTTHTDLIARLRSYDAEVKATPEEAADAIESLEQQVAAQQSQMYEDRRQALVWRDQVAVLTKERDEDALLQPRITMSNLEMASALAAAQAREAKLREALAMIHLMGMHQNDRTTAQEALALHADDSALQARLKEERERICNMASLNLSERQRDGITGLA